MPTIETRTNSKTGEVRYRVRVRDPQPGIEKAGFTSATFATTPEAEWFVTACEQKGVAWALAEYRRDKGADSITLNEWAEKHFNSLTKPSGSTVRRYRRIYDECWKAPLGHLPLTTITRTDCATALKGVPGSDKTRKNKWAVLTHMLKTAMYEGLIPRTPAVGIELGRHSDHETEENQFLTIDEFSKILAATPHHWRPLILTLAGTGIRYGEAAALTVADVDLDNGTLRVNKAEKSHPDIPNKTIVGPTKSLRSRRTNALPSTLLDVLADHVEGRKKTERLFLPPEGGPLRHRTFYRDIWLRKILPNAGIDRRPRLHDLRHSHVAWLIAQGTPLPVIQARLGHEKITTTIDTYGHLLPDLQRAAAEAAEVVLTGIKLPGRDDDDPPRILAAVK
jgi:integrase